MLRKIRNLWRIAGMEMMKKNSGKTHVRFRGPFVLPEQVSYVVRPLLITKNAILL
jgi:hypothetical protein